MFLVFSVQNAFAANSENGRFYASCDIALLEYSNENGFDYSDILVLMGVAGYKINQYVSLETKFGSAVKGKENSSQQVSVLGAGQTQQATLIGPQTTLDYLIGAFGRFSYPIAKNVSICGFIGVSQTRVSAEFPELSFNSSPVVPGSSTQTIAGSKKTDNITDWTYGFSFQYRFHENYEVGASYFNYMPNSREDLAGFEVNLTKLF